jgi:Flp pilus assembly protein protease CpaA
VGAGDIRLMYGLAVPLVVAVVLIAVYLFVGEWWLLPPLALVLLLLSARMKCSTKAPVMRKRNPMPKPMRTIAMTRPASICGATSP